MEAITKTDQNWGNLFTITVTNTATSLKSLIQTALSDTTFSFKHNERAIKMYAPEGATNIRYRRDGQSPTTSSGELLKADTPVNQYGTRLDNYYFITESGTQTLDVVIGQWTEGMPSDSEGGGSGGGSSATASASSFSASEFTSPSDFTAEYTSASTITLKGLPFTIADSSQIGYVSVVASDNTTTTYTAGTDGISFGVSSNVLTIYQRGVAITTLDSGDTYQVGIDAQKKAYDPSTQSDKVSTLNPQYSRSTDAESILSSAQDLTGSWADLGPEIACDGFNRLGVWLTIDINDSEDVRIKAIAKHESGGTEEYGLPIYNPDTSTGGSYVTYAEGNYIEFNDDADQLIYVGFDVDNAIPYVQLQVEAGTVGGTAGQIDAAYVTRGYA
jgi:hypothetical protein